MEWTTCHWPGCDAPAETLYTFTLPAVTFDGSDSVVYFERRNCVKGHYCDVEIYDDASAE